MKPLSIRLGGYQPPASIHTRSAAFFGERLERRLDGRVAFELVGDVLALGRNSGELPEMVARGELSLCYISTVRFSRAVAELAAFELPFVVSDRGAVFRTLDGALGDALGSRVLGATGLRVLGFWDNGFRHLTNRVRPIRRPADCAGLRIRTQMSALHGETFRALGFEPIAADIREFAAAIAGERFEAQDNPLANIYSFGVHRHHRYITLTGHFFGVSVLVCNEAHYRSWPGEVRAAVHEAAREATALQRRLAVEEDEAVLRRLDPEQNEVIHLTQAERAEFVRAVQPVLDRHRARLDAQTLACLASAG
jgi:TRAP-type C4-dicarboxylate transport system substrate-binding protein